MHFSQLKMKYTHPALLRSVCSPLLYFSIFFPAPGKRLALQFQKKKNYRPLTHLSSFDTHTTQFSSNTVFLLFFGTHKFFVKKKVKSFIFLVIFRIFDDLSLFCPWLAGVCVCLFTSSINFIFLKWQQRIDVPIFYVAYEFSKANFPGQGRWYFQHNSRTNIALNNIFLLFFLFTTTVFLL